MSSVVSPHFLYTLTGDVKFLSFHLFLHLFVNSDIKVLHLTFMIVHISNLISDFFSLAVFEENVEVLS